MSTIQTSPACYDEPRVTALYTRQDGSVQRLHGLALWVAQLPDRPGESTKIIGGFRYRDAAGRREPVSLVKVYA